MQREKDRLDLAETAKHLAQIMSEPRKIDFVPLKRAARYLVGKPKAAIRFRSQEHVDKTPVFVDSGFAGESSLEKEHDWSGGTGWRAHSEIRIHTSALDRAQCGRNGVLHSCEGGQVGLPLRSIYTNLGIQMKVVLRSDSSTANSLTDRLGAGPRTKHMDTRYFWVQGRVRDGGLSVKKVLEAEMCADVGTKPVSDLVLQICRIGILLTTDPAPHCKMMGLML